jgi:hypothetical protein
MSAIQVQGEGGLQWVDSDTYLPVAPPSGQGSNGTSWADTVGGTGSMKDLAALGITGEHLQAAGFRDNGNGTATRMELREDPTAAINNSHDIGRFMPAGIMALATAGMGGYLPGTESMFAGAAGAGAGETAAGASLSGGGGGAGAVDASWGVNPQTFGGPMSTAATTVNPATLATEFGAPMSTTAALQGTSLLPGATQLLPIGSAPFSLADLLKKKPTTGNEMVDNLLMKAATTALGAGNSASAGAGGDTTAAAQQAADEARKQALIEQINAMYAPENFKDEEDNLSGAIRGQQGDALKLGYDNAARSTTFDAARRGNVGGSVMADNIAGLNRDNQLGGTKIEDAVNSTLAGMRSSRLSSQNNAISLANAGSGPEAVNAAATGIKNSIDTAQAAKVPDVTQGLFQNVALSNEGINAGVNAGNKNAYTASRLSGGGSLFPLGSGATGRNVAV